MRLSVVLYMSCVHEDEASVSSCFVLMIYQFSHVFVVFGAVFLVVVSLTVLKIVASNK